jgi:hypothetical protein
LCQATQAMAKVSSKITACFMELNNTDE